MSGFSGSIPPPRFVSRLVRIIRIVAVYWVIVSIVCIAGADLWARGAMAMRDGGMGAMALPLEHARWFGLLILSAAVLLLLMARGLRDRKAWSLVLLKGLAVLVLVLWIPWIVFVFTTITEVDPAAPVGTLWTIAVVQVAVLASAVYWLFARLKRPDVMEYFAGD